VYPLMEMGNILDCVINIGDASKYLVEIVKCEDAAVVDSNQT